MKRKQTPWTEEEVEKLKQHQTNSHFHPYTCPSHQAVVKLIPGIDGWKCLFCSYKQDWYWSEK